MKIVLGFDVWVFDLSVNDLWEDDKGLVRVLWPGLEEEEQSFTLQIPK